MSKERDEDRSITPADAAEARIIDATVGTPHLLKGTIHLAPYDPAWPTLFSRLAREISAVLGDRVRLLEHVGSTSVRGLSAKPFIDMVLVVDDSEQERSYVPPLEAIGCTLRIREPNWHHHRVLIPLQVPGKLHVFSVGCSEVERMLHFRDWLRSHDDDRALYEHTKQELARRTWRYVQDYADAKSEVIREILSRAYSGAATDVKDSSR